MKATVAPKALFPRYQSATINDQDYETIKIHLMALKLTTVNYIPTTTGGMALFWSLTPKGHALLMEFRSVKKTQKPN